LFYSGLVRVSDRVAALAALGEPTRRRLYELVAASGEGLTRDAAAAALGVPRSVAAFHLDKLAAAGLLDVDHRRPPDRRGPGAGRPAKWYRRSATDVTVSVPERRYDLAARVLASAVERATAVDLPVSAALADVAREQGRDLLPDGSAGPAAVTEALAGAGYEPAGTAGVVTLANCPFSSLTAEHRSLVCGMNLDLIRGLAEAAGLPPDAVRLDPGPGRCCVTIAA
jgi:predicted ArsR family transcriptional regulator